MAGLGAGGALLFGWSLLPPRQRLRGAAAPALTPGAVLLNGWLAVSPDDTVTIVSPKAEMGQGIHTALAMLVAEELSCDWARITVTASGVDPIYNNVAAIVDGLPFHEDLDDNGAVRSVRWLTSKFVREAGVMMTSASSSVRDCWEVARLAGATARVSFVEAAAARWGIPASDCTVANGVVRSAKGSLRFGELLAEAAKRQPDRVALKAPSAFTRIGTDTARLEARDKVRGTATFGIDVSRPGMKYAAVAMPPTLGSAPVGANREAALARPGVRAVVALEGSSYGDPPAMAIIADSWWQAKQALAALDVQWSASPHGALSSAGIMATLRAEALTDDGLPIRSVGNALDALTTSDRVIESVYEAPYLAHATMEPMNATVQVRADGVEVWLGTQVPTFAQQAAARTAGVEVQEVTLHQQLLGGGFGRRLEADYVAQATAIAKAMPGVPVQTLWSREDDMRHDVYRPATVQRLRAGLDASGRVTAVVAHSAGQAPFEQMSRRIDLVWTKHGVDRTTSEGTWDQPYEFPALRASHAELELPVPVGLWRSVGHSHQGFFFESFVDELATATAQDPLAFRLSLLGEHPRAAAVLRLAASKAGWGTPEAPAPDGQPVARGLALHSSFGSTVAQVAEVSVGIDRRIRVHRVVCAIDCGLAVNPVGVRQQLEGSIIFGLSAALRGEITVTRGRINQGTFFEYAPLRMDECPVIETHIVPSARRPAGVGEPALPPIAPAVGNALFALTGTRLRSLPLQLPPMSASGV